MDGAVPRSTVQQRRPKVGEQLVWVAVTAAFSCGEAAGRLCPSAAPEFSSEELLSCLSPKLFFPLTCARFLPAQGVDCIEKFCKRNRGRRWEDVRTGLQVLTLQRLAMDSIYLLMCFSLSQLFLDRILAAETHGESPIFPVPPSLSTACRKWNNKQQNNSKNHSQIWLILELKLVQCLVLVAVHSHICSVWDQKFSPFTWWCQFIVFLSSLFLIHSCANVILTWRLSVPSEKLSGKLSEYGLIVPFSTDSHGRYISHVVSAASASPSGDNDTDGSPGDGSTGANSTSGHQRRVARSAPQAPSVTSAASQHLFFNVTVFGKELHLRLRANRRLVAPGAFVEWHEDFVEKTKERIHRDCVFTGDVSDMPDASVAISNCDGLVSDPYACLLFEQKWVMVQFKIQWEYWLGFLYRMNQT